MSKHIFEVPLRIVVEGAVDDSDAMTIFDNILVAMEEMAMQDSFGTDIVYHFEFGKLVK